jgi:hypothetical protein
MNTVAWVFIGVFCGILFSIIMYAIGMMSTKPDFEDYDEWESGSVNVKAYNKAQHDIDTDRMRDEFNDQSS